MLIAHSFIIAVGYFFTIIDINSVTKYYTLYLMYYSVIFVWYNAKKNKL